MHKSNVLALIVNQLPFVSSRRRLPISIQSRKSYIAALRRYTEIKDFALWSGHNYFPT